MEVLELMGRAQVRSEVSRMSVKDAFVIPSIPSAARSLPQAVSATSGGVQFATSLLILCFIGVNPPARAESNDERPSLFMLGGQQVGVALGYGHGVKFGNSGVIEGHKVKEIVFVAHWEIDITRPPISKRWARGRLALRLEGTYFHSFEPHSGDAGGAALLLRYKFLYWKRVHPFLQAGAGILSLDYDLLDQADGFAFQPQAGVGILWMINSSHSLEIAWRFHHISNAYTQEPNGGIDRSQLILGYAYHF
jgi:hypothetical protein